MVLAAENWVCHDFHRYLLQKGEACSSEDPNEPRTSSLLPISFTPFSPCCLIFEHELSLSLHFWRWIFMKFDAEKVVILVRRKAREEEGDKLIGQYFAGEIYYFWRVRRLGMSQLTIRLEEAIIWRFRLIFLTLNSRWTKQGSAASRLQGGRILISRTKFEKGRGTDANGQDCRPAPTGTVGPVPGPFCKRARANAKRRSDGLD